MKSAGLFSSFVAVLLTVSWAGCGRGGLVPVEGVVTLDGQPLAGATVSLKRSEGPIKERIFLGETDATGHYEITTIDGSSVGVPPGDYRVTITTVKLPPDANELTILPPERVPHQWRSGAESFQVPQGGTTDADFHMTSR